MGSESTGGPGSGVRKPRSDVIRSFTRVNHKIRVPKVRCVDREGNMLGIMATRDAMKLAGEADLDLVEISPNADPPVCRVMDFGKFRYEEGRKQKLARRNQSNHSVKEVKFHANVGDHDYETKLGHIRAFLDKGHTVRVSLTFRGRENVHRELGFQLVERVIKDCEELSVVDMRPKMVGRSVVCMLGVRMKK